MSTDVRPSLRVRLLWVLTAGLLFWAGLVRSEDEFTAIKWGESRSGLQIGLPTSVIANRDFPTAETAEQPLAIHIRNSTETALAFLQAGRYAGLDFHFITRDGRKLVLANPKPEEAALVVLQPGETKVIEVQLPVRELHHFDLPLVASIELSDPSGQIRQRVFSPEVRFVVTD